MSKATRCLSCLIFILCNSCDRPAHSEDNRIESGTESDLRLKVQDDYERIYNAAFEVVEKSLEKEEQLHDPYYGINLPPEIVIPENVLEISVKITGISGTFLLNGMSIEDASEKFPGRSYLVTARVKTINERLVTVSIKELIEELKF
ncbi:MAG: hypothetical protein AB8D78_04970 [Akkermansiaceae bacterium]